MLLPVVAGAILFFTYLVLAVGRAPYLRIDRPGAAIVGATLMIATGVISLDEAYRHIDFRTLVLLFGMMVLIAHLRMARFFSATVQWIGARVHQPALLLVTVVFVSGILSALFVNDTICLVFTPVLIELARARGHRPLPYLLALVTGANIGSVATITGNPQNMLIASLSHIRYAPFLSALGPVALFGLALDALVLTLMFRDDLRPGPLESAGPRPRPIHRAMMIKGLLVTAFVLAAFLLGMDPALVAAVAAAALLITRRVNPQKIYRQIDWDLLVMFIGLFVVIGGVEQVGLARRLFDLLAPIGLHTVTGLSVVTTAVSEPDQQRARCDAPLAAHPTAAGSKNVVADARDVEHPRRQPDTRRIDRQSHRPRRRAATGRGDFVLAILQGRRAGHGADAAVRDVVAGMKRTPVW